ncbi:MAG: hypothetical protein JWN70_6785 [Planctomycetaceae bacterium]|nr:hypothetical protein [Planctomycetaceae bacterium]
MRTIPRALIWELLVQGRWMLILGVLAANFMPALLFTALAQTGPIDPTDSSFSVLCVMLTQIHLFIFGAMVFFAQGQVSRLYAAPVPNSTLVIWHMLPAMFLVAAELVLSTMAFNAAFHFNWPLWGPALFVAAAVPAMQATFWQTEKSLWLPLILGIVGGALGLWFKSRFGPTFSPAQHLWSNVTPAEIATLTVVAIVSYYAAVAGVARNRRGDTIPPLGIVAWIGRILDQPGRADRPFKSPAQAQHWFEFEQKGWALPAAVLLGLVFGVSVWTIFNRDPHDLFQGFLVGGGAISIVAFVGSMIMGHTGSIDTSYEMGHFLASRPITTRELSRIILEMVARSILLAWSIWAVAFLIFYLIAMASGVTLQPKFPARMLWLYFPATLLGPWIVCTAGASMGLTGHRWFFIEIVCGGLFVFIMSSLISQYFLSREERVLLARVCAEVIGVLLVLGTAWAMIAARQRAMISWPTVYAASGVWVIATALIVFFRFGVLKNEQHPILIMIGLLALAVAPVATAPLALAWNRNR